jgi:hypothetical protein
MNYKSLIAVICYASTSFVEGRIGDSPEDCMKRYHDPAIERRGWNETEFQKGAIDVTTKYQAGKCVRIYYRIFTVSVVILPPFEKSPKFTETQAMKFLALNTDEAQWRKKTDYDLGAAHEGVYETLDGKMHALVSGDQVCVETTAVYKERLTKLETEQIDQVLTEFGAKGTPRINTHAGKWDNPEEVQERENSKKTLEAIQESLEEEKKLNDENLKRRMEAIHKSFDELQKLGDEVKGSVPPPIPPSTEGSPAQSPP